MVWREGFFVDDAGRLAPAFLTRHKHVCICTHTHTATPQQITCTGTLLALLDHCSTPFGRRRLRRWLVRPLFRAADIARRQDAVEELMGRLADAAGAARRALAGVSDVERALARLAASAGVEGGVVRAAGILFLLHVPTGASPPRARTHKPSFNHLTRTHKPAPETLQKQHPLTHKQRNTIHPPNSRAARRPTSCCTRTSPRSASAASSARSATCARRGARSRRSRRCVRTAQRAGGGGAPGRLLLLVVLLVEGSRGRCVHTLTRTHTTTPSANQTNKTTHKTGRADERAAFGARRRRPVGAARRRARRDGGGRRLEGGRRDRARRPLRPRRRRRLRCRLRRRRRRRGGAGGLPRRGPGCAEVPRGRLCLTEQGEPRARGARGGGGARGVELPAGEALSFGGAFRAAQSARSEPPCAAPVLQAARPPRPPPLRLRLDDFQPTHEQLLSNSKFKFSLKQVSQKKGFKRFTTERLKALVRALADAKEAKEGALGGIVHSLEKRFARDRALWAAAVEAVATLDALMALAGERQGGRERG